MEAMADRVNPWQPWPHIAKRDCVCPECLGYRSALNAKLLASHKQLMETTIAIRDSVVVDQLLGQTTYPEETPE